MSLLTLTKSFKKYISDPRNFSGSKFVKTKEYLKNFEFLSSDASLRTSVKLTKKIAYMCNSKFYKTRGLLKIAEEILLAWMKSAKLNQLNIPESILKLLIITYLHKSFVHENLKPQKAIDSLIKANKVHEEFLIKSRKGKMLKFITKLRLCEIYIKLHKYEQGIMSAEQVLKEVLEKLGKYRKKTKFLNELGMAAVTAFYRIGICEQNKGLEKAAEIAFEKANIIGKEFLNKDQILLELDYEMITHRKFFPIKSARPKKIAKAAEIRIEKPSVTNRIEESKSERVLNKSNSPNLSQKKSFFNEGDSDLNILARYYSNKDLERLEKILHTDKNSKIISTDTFFFNKISKSLAISKLRSSPELIHQKINNTIQEVWRSKESLKSKKKVKQVLPFLGNPPEDIEKRLENIEEMFESKLKIQELKMQSKLKTKIYRNLLRSINVPSRSKTKHPPMQRLYFRPPDKRKEYQNTLSLQPIKIEPLPHLATKVEEINQEIEEQLEELMQDINGQNDDRNHIKESAKTCELAMSASRVAKDNDNIKKSIRKYLLNNVKPKKSLLKNG